MLSMQDKAICLGRHCLQSAIMLNDEMLIADSLIELYSLYSDNKNKREIENIMITHYFNTQYELVRQKMLTCFEDLEYVEKNKNHDEMLYLFENLMDLNF
jgi:hypothetical protein